MSKFAKFILVALLAMGGSVYAVDVQAKKGPEATAPSDLTNEVPGDVPVAEAAPEVPALAFQSFDVLIENETPRACFVFNTALAGVPATLQNYVTVAPAGDFAVDVKDGKLCLNGLKFGASYDVTLRAGLPMDGYTPLAADVAQNVKVPDHAPSLTFRSSGTVLARDGDGGLPIRSINISSAKVQILRVNDRNLVNSVTDGLIKRTLYPYSVDQLADGNGEKVYEGILDITNKPNEWATTSIPVKSAITDLKPGIYVAAAAPDKVTIESTSSDDDDDDNDNSRWKAMATQWFVVSDIGLSAFVGEDGLMVSARSLVSTAPMAKLDVTLYARNNSELATIRTNDQGIARIAPGLLRGTGGNTPRLLMVRDKASNDFAYLDIDDSQMLDLTDRGNAGRNMSGPLDAYVVTERGIYRPGEPVHATILLRNRDLTAPDELPLTVKVLRPDGVEAKSLSLTGSKAGGYSFDYPTAVTTMTGLWTVNVFADPAQPAIGTVDFEVEDFQPPRLEFDLKADAPSIPASGQGTVSLDARFLYGAPASGLKGNNSINLGVAATPFEKYADYSFGLAEEELLPSQVNQTDFDTDDAGHASLSVDLGKLPDTTHPLEAHLTADLFDIGGRAITHDITVPVRNLPLNIGIHSDGDIKVNTDAGFDVVALDADGNPIAHDKLHWILYEEKYDYYWGLFNGTWRYDPLITGVRVAGGDFAVTADKPAHITAPVGYGYYRMEVRDDENKLVASSLKFTAGWWSRPDSSNKPDAVKVTYNPDKLARAGGSVTVHVTAPYASQATVIAATYNLGNPQQIALPAEGKDIEVKVPDGASSGFYVLVSAIQKTGDEPPASAHGVPLRRAMGLVWVPLDLAANKLNVSIDTPELVRPNQTLNANIKIEGVDTGEVYLTLAAVDDGVLQLTDYESPNPDKWFYGQSLLGIKAFDLYGDLINSSDSVRGVMHEGGDGGDARQLKGIPEQTTKIVSLYSGIVKVEKGVAAVPLVLPDFNGRLRLMAMAWSKNSVGQAEKQMTVRAPLVADLMLPRFLAPGDNAAIQLSLDNRDAAAGSYHVEFAVKGPAELTSPNGRDATLAQGQRVAIPLQLKATTVGQVQMDMKVTGPDNFLLNRTFNISVRPAAQTQITRTIAVIKPGETLNPPVDLSMYLPGTSDLTLSLSPIPDIDIPYLLKDLINYPYGCAEQTVSTAMPLLYMEQVAAGLNLAKVDDMRERIRYAIAKLADIQRSDGGFGLWGRDDEYQLWLTAYVGDFLTRAAAQHYVVPGTMRTSLLARLATSLKNGQPDDKELTGRAYAFYVLAKNQAVVVNDLRYFADTYGAKLPSSLARAQLAAALKLVGDTARLPAALTAIDALQPGDGASYDYGSPLRDSAGTIAVMAEEGLGDTSKLLAQLALLKTPELNFWAWHFYSTQEESWLLLAVNAMMEKTGGHLQVKVGDTAIEQTKPVYRTYHNVQSEPVINTGNADVYQSLTVSAVPVALQPAGGDGTYELERKYYALDGSEIADLSTVTQNQMVVVALFGTSSGKYSQDVVISDLLPAGFEIENMRLSKNDRTESMNWLDNIAPSKLYISRPDRDFPDPINTEIRSDRFVAATRLVCDSWCHQMLFRTTYMMRAVTPGHFLLPGAYVEDMYRPQHFARTASTNVTVAPAQ